MPSARVVSPTFNSLFSSAISVSSRCSWASHFLCSSSTAWYFLNSPSCISSWFSIMQVSLRCKTCEFMLTNSASTSEHHCSTSAAASNCEALTHNSWTVAVSFSISSADSVILRSFSVIHSSLSVSYWHCKLTSAVRLIISSLASDSSLSKSTNRELSGLKSLSFWFSLFRLFIFHCKLFICIFNASWAILWIANAQKPLS